MDLFVRRWSSRYEIEIEIETPHDSGDAERRIGWVHGFG